MLKNGSITQKNKVPEVVHHFILLVFLKILYRLLKTKSTIKAVKKKFNLAKTSNGGPPRNVGIIKTVNRAYWRKNLPLFPSCISNEKLV